MTDNDPGRLRLQSRLSLVVLAIGLALMTMMIVVEDEPGALPLGLVVFGLGWFLFTWYRRR